MHRPTICVTTVFKRALNGTGTTVHLKDKEGFSRICKEEGRDEEEPEFFFYDGKHVPHDLVHDFDIEDRFWDFLDLDEEDQALWLAFVEAFGISPTSIGEARDAYKGSYASQEDFVKARTDENLELPDWLIVDWAASWTRNMSDDYSVADFRNELWFFSKY